LNVVDQNKKQPLFKQKIGKIGSFIFPFFKNIVSVTVTDAGKKATSGLH